MMTLNRQDKQKLCLYKRAMLRQVVVPVTTEAKNAFIRAMKADSVYRVISDMDQYLRDKIKYGNLTDSEQDMMQEIRSTLWDLMKGSGIDLENDWS